MRIFLGITDKHPIPDGYDKYIWIYERCVSGISFCKEKNKNYCIIPNPYKDASDLYRINEYIANLVVEVVEYLAPYLNEYLNKNYTAEGWGYMLIRDYDLVYSILYDLYRRIKTVLDLGIKADYYCFDNLDQVFFVDTYDYGKASTKDEFYQYLACLLINELDTEKLLTPIPKWKYALGKKDSSDKKRQIKEQIYNVIRFFLRLVRNQNEEKVVIMDAYLPTKVVYKLLLMHPGKIGNYSYNYPALYANMIDGNVDYAWRNSKVDNVNASDEFERMALMLSRKLLPMAALENYEKIEELSKYLYRYAINPNAIVFSSSAFYRNECFKSYLMQMRSAGKGVFCNIQHGGSGVRTGAMDILEQKYSDTFYTWGWSNWDYSVCHIKAMPMSKTIGYKAKTTATIKDRFLYVDYSYGKYNWELQSVMIFYDEARENAIEFFTGLPDILMKKIVFRKLSEPYHLSITEDRRIQALDLSYDDIIDFYESVNRSTLIICSSLETTWIEALYFDVPFICFVDQRCEILKVAQADMKKMEELGIMHDSFDSIRKQLDIIQDDVLGWWKQSEREKFVTYLRYKYARKTNDAEKQWMTEIESYL